MLNTNPSQFLIQRRCYSTAIQSILPRRLISRVVVRQELCLLLPRNPWCPTGQSLERCVALHQPHSFRPLLKMLQIPRSWGLIPQTIIMVYARKIGFYQTLSQGLHIHPSNHSFQQKLPRVKESLKSNRY